MNHKLTSIIFLKQVLKTAEDIMKILVTLPEYPDATRNYGFFYAYIPLDQDGIVLFHRSVGDVNNAPQDKLANYYNFSEEKAMRLLEHQNERHVSSCQSHNEEERKYIGAIRCNEVILSFSGLPELWDEALCLVVAVKMDLISEEAARNIATISKNNFFQLLLDATK